MKRRLLSILLLICMTLTLFPVPAFAEEDTEEAPVCVCAEACTEGAVNYACPVCGAEGAQACSCAEEVIVVNAVDDTDDACDADEVGDADDVDTPETAVYSAYAATGVTYILNYYLNDGTENTVEIRYHMYNPDGDVEYKTDGTSAILTDYTTTPEDYELRGLGAIFQFLQAAGMFTGLDEAGNELDGWYQARSFADTDRVTELSQLTVTGKQVDLYGRIIPKTITITLELGGGELPEGVSNTVTRTYGSWYNLPKPARHGYRFTYWYTAETGGREIFQATTITQTTDHSVYSRWKQEAGHSPVRDQNPETLKTPADCEHDAVYYMSCSCGEIIKTATFTATGTALGHDYVNCSSNDDGTHTGVCSRDNSTGTEPCTGGTATCTAKAVCGVCGKEYGELASHSFTAENADAKYLKSAASCTAKAVYYKSCAACGLSSKGAADEATFEAGNILGHDYGSWTSNGDGTHTGVCSRDANHTKTEACTDGTATCTAKAVCGVCGKEYGGACIPQLHSGERGREVPQDCCKLHGEGSVL